jgi:hypothetical protein
LCSHLSFRKEVPLVSIVPFFQGAQFDAETTSAMGQAFDAICGGYAGPNHHVVREVIAMRILAAAATGERDPAKLCASARTALGIAHQS